ncbi:uncharacterized protein LOC132732970 [Ruditapes philippinarum]|uniref:uncharacterized protein LOC132732970 n=1 Tax=Ruditapes philippinarum TaxID=129788 RepID=UPI00295BF39B|nr:uncharacterized protein LOC132732970 [Ruditapes philippinarum]
MSKLDAEKLIKNIENIIMNDTVNANNETWAYMSTLVDSIVRSLLDLENADITGVEDWFQPILKALENMGNTAETESYEEVCERTLQYTMSTEMYTTWVKPYMDSVHTFIMISNSVMNVQIGVDEAVCQMQMKNITDVIKYLDDRGLIRELKKIEEMMSQKNRDRILLRKDFNIYWFL